jgi:hypothetical protein
MITSLYDAYILDTGDFYILAFEKKEFNNNIINTIIDLYKTIDITINVIKLDLKIPITLEIKNFIKSICGRVIPYNRSEMVININKDHLNMGSIIDKLKNDLDQIITFYKIKAFWSSYGSDTYNFDNINLVVTKPDIKLPNIDDNDENAIIYSNVSDEFDKRILPSDWAGTCIIKSDNIYLNAVSTKMLLEDIPTYTSDESIILYNNMYNISLFITKVSTNIKDLCLEFPEFEVIEVFKNNKINSNIIENCNIFFNKKTYTNKEELSSKIESFKKLYDLNNKEVELTEKQKVFQYLNNMYIIDNDSNNKIGANELYSLIMNNICVLYTDKVAFKKRLAGYLIEIGLVRKRYSDGYSYYGIKNRYSNIKLDNNSIEELLKKRTHELET